MGWLDDIENAVEGALDSLGDVVSAIEDAVKSGAKIAGTVIEPIGEGIQYVVNGVAYKLADLVGIHMRKLTLSERAVLSGVFQNAVPLDKVLVTSIPGKDGRPFTIPGSMVTTLSLLIPVLGPLVTLESLMLNLLDKYLINVGGMYSDKALLPSTYDTNKRERAGSMLVHETTHVWQGVHSAFSWWYVFQSLYTQAQEGSHAYDVDESHLQTWNRYGVEQQAHLVEDWFTRGSLTTDVCYPFIRDNVRPGKPNAETRFPVKLNPVLAGKIGSIQAALTQTTTTGPTTAAAQAAARAASTRAR